MSDIQRRAKTNTNLVCKAPRRPSMAFPSFSTTRSSFVGSGVTLGLSLPIVISGSSSEWGHPRVAPTGRYLTGHQVNPRCYYQRYPPDLPYPGSSRIPLTRQGFLQLFPGRR